MDTITPRERPGEGTECGVARMAPGPPRHGLLRARRSRHVEAHDRPRSGNLSDPRDPFAQLRALSAEHVDENGTHGSARRPCTGFQMAGCAARGMHDRRVVIVGEDDVFPGWELPENIRIDTSATAAIASPTRHNTVRHVGARV